MGRLHSHGPPLLSSIHPYLDMSSYSIPQCVFLSLTTAAGMPGLAGEFGSDENLLAKS